MLIPKFTTFTGADDQTSIAEMKALAADHPVEFGILFSRSREGDVRYPTQDWMKGLDGSGLNLAAHVCGVWASQIVETGRSDIDDRLLAFGRIQVNTAQPIDREMMIDWAGRLSHAAGRTIPIILQSRGAFPDDPAFHWLEDRSGGRGVAPGSWPAPPSDLSVTFGYAGGLGPDNVAEVLGSLPHSAGVWIDMESRVRDAEDRFDLKLCAKVCETVATFRQDKDMTP